MAYPTAYHTHIDAETGKVTKLTSSQLCNYEYDAVISTHGGFQTYITFNKSDPKSTCFDIAPHVHFTIIDENLTQLRDDLIISPSIVTIDDLANSAHAKVDAWSNLCNVRWKSSYGHAVIWLPEKNQAIIYYKVGVRLIKNLPKSFTVRTITMKMFGMEYQMTSVSNNADDLITIPDGWKQIKDTLIMIDKSGFNKIIEEYGEYVRNNISGTYKKIESYYTIGKTIIWISWLKKFILLHKNVNPSEFPKIGNIAEATFDEKVFARIYIIYDSVDSVKSFTMKPFKKSPTIRFIN